MWSDVMSMARGGRRVVRRGWVPGKGNGMRGGKATWWEVFVVVVLFVVGRRCVVDCS